MQVEVQVHTSPVDTAQYRSLPLCSMHSLMDVGGFVLKSAAGESKSLFRVSPALQVTLRLGREVVIADGVCNCVAPCSNYFASIRYRTLRRGPLRPCVREVPGANVGWDATPQGSCSCLCTFRPDHVPHSTFFQLFSILFISIVPLGEVRSEKLINWLFGVRLVAYNLAYRCEVRKPTEPRQRVRTNFNIRLV